MKKSNEIDRERAANEFVSSLDRGTLFPPLSDEKKKKVRSYLLSSLFLIGLMALTFYIISRDTSPAELIAVLKTTDLFYVVCGIAMMAGYFLFRAFNFRTAARCIKTHMTAGEALQYSCIGFFYSGITPSSTGGQPMEFYHMCRDKLSAGKATLVLFIVNITYQFVLVALGIFMFCCKAGYIASIHGSLIAIFFISLSFNFAMLLLLAGVLYSETAMKKFLGGCVKFLAKVKIIKDVDKANAKVEKYIAEFRAGAQLIKYNQKRFVYILLGTIGQTICSLAVPCFVYRAFGLTGWSFFDMLAVNTIVFVTVSLFPLPGSVGAAESGFVLLLSAAFGKYIVPAMVLSRFINFYTMMVICGCVAAFAQLRRPYNLAAHTVGLLPETEAADEG
jgi:uncharacterized protein (TIRG00374 family)